MSIVFEFSLVCSLDGFCWCWDEYLIMAFMRALVFDMLYSYLAWAVRWCWWRFGDVSCVLCNYALSFRVDRVT